EQKKASVQLYEKLTTLRDGGADRQALMAALTGEEIEQMLESVPKAPGDLLVLFAIFTAPGARGSTISEDRFAQWVQSCTCWLCLE
ncbi:hypothetical protein, partial [Pseudomonas sp. FW215-T2]|uniref:hypothetical protein n=1 Tax=Pseudomonas sp. FW215-T2 TaxID=2070672 RepID=UPI000CB997EC